MLPVFVPELNPSGLTETWNAVPPGSAVAEPGVTLSQLEPCVTVANTLTLLPETVRFAVCCAVVPDAMLNVSGFGDTVMPDAPVPVLPEVGVQPATPTPRLTDANTEPWPDGVT